MPFGKTMLKKCQCLSILYYLLDIMFHCLMLYDHIKELKNNFLNSWKLFFFSCLDNSKMAEQTYLNLSKKWQKDKKNIIFRAKNFLPRGNSLKMLPKIRNNHFKQWNCFFLCYFCTWNHSNFTHVHIMF